MGSACCGLQVWCHRFNMSSYGCPSQKRTHLLCNRAFITQLPPGSCKAAPGLSATTRRYIDKQGRRRCCGTKKLRETQWCPQWPHVGPHWMEVGSWWFVVSGWCHLGVSRFSTFAWCVSVVAPNGERDAAPIRLPVSVLSCQIKDVPAAVRPSAG